MRVRRTDALGRLTKVIEDPSGLHYLTSYTYDVLGNLKSVTQGSESRTFVYDGLSRLTSAANPESGTISYSYDPVGNLLTKRDNRGIITCSGSLSGSTCTSGYDPLNRLTQKSYSDGTPAVSYFYDANGVANAIGRLTQVHSAVSTTYTTGYDALGRVTSSTQNTSGQNYTLAYNYNLTGSLISETYPSGRTITTCYDSADRVNQVSGSLSGSAACLGAQNTSNLSSCPSYPQNGPQTNYAFYISYAPQGEPSGIWFGNSLAHVNYFNNRLQLSAITDAVNNCPNGLLLTTNLSWGTLNSSQNGVLPSTNNGNLGFVTTTHSGPGMAALTFNTAFTYDGVNRLQTAGDSGGWSRNFSYDPFGNLWAAGSGIALAGNTPSTNVYNGNNQISGASYDAAGNQTAANGNSLSYDAENRQTAVTEAGNGSVTSVYDGDGQRVAKLFSNGSRTVYVYDALKRLVAEYSVNAVPSPCQTCYLSYDHLGSVRLVTDQNANVISRHDYLPFGEEILASTACRTSQWGPNADTITQKFTGKERDAESGLDYFGARYFASSMGRMMSPDWSAKAMPVPYAKLDNPQSLNLYAYVLNNPLRYIDADGHYELNASNCGDNAKCQKKYNKAADKFEKTRQKDLKSKNETIRNAAANYGAKGEANGVHVGFADLSAQHIDGSVDPSGSTPGNPNIQVQMDFSRAGSAETQSHEGTHIGDDMKFLNSFDPATGGYNQALNPTHFQTEFNAFRAGAMVNHEHGFGPNDVQGITDYINRNYPARILNLPVFNPQNFPAGVPDDVQ